jgi:hypothetical protein
MFVKILSGSKKFCQYEILFSKWPTIVKISRVFLARSAGNSVFLKMKNKKSPCGTENGCGR